MFEPFASMSGSLSVDWLMGAALPSSSNAPGSWVLWLIPERASSPVSRLDVVARFPMPTVVSFGSGRPFSSTRTDPSCRIPISSRPSPSDPTVTEMP